MMLNSISVFFGPYGLNFPSVNWIGWFSFFFFSSGELLSSFPGRQVLSGQTFGNDEDLLKDSSTMLQTAPVKGWLRHRYFLKRPFIVTNVDNILTE